MLNNCTMQMQTLIDQKAKEAAQQRSLDGDFGNAGYNYTTGKVKKEGDILLKLGHVKIQKFSIC